MTHEEDLRRLLNDAATEIPTGNAPVAELVTEGRRSRNRRNVVQGASGAAAVAVIAVGAFIVGPSIGGSGDLAAQPTAPQMSQSPTSTVPSTTTTTTSATTEPQGCPVGEERAVNRNASRTSVLLGCARLDDGRKVELFGAGGLCLQILGIDNRIRECGNAPSEQEPPQTARAVAAQMIAQRNASASLEVYGATSVEVSTVELRYTRDGSSHSTRAELIRVTDSGALEEARIGEPFGYFLAELPPETSKVRAIALDADGQELGGDDFEPFLRSQPRTAPISGFATPPTTPTDHPSGSQGIRTARIAAVAMHAHVKNLLTHGSNGITDVWLNESVCNRIPYARRDNGCRLWTPTEKKVLIKNLSDLGSVSFVSNRYALRLPQPGVAYARAAAVVTESETLAYAKVAGSDSDSSGWKEGGRLVCGWQTWELQRSDSDWNAALQRPLGTCG